MNAGGRAPTRAVAAQVRRRLKPLYLRGKTVVARTLFGYSAEALAQGVRSLGIAAGDSVFLHSGFSRASGFRGTPSDVIECLLSAVGPNGHLLMMSIPYRGSSQRYAESNPLFDVLRTPSAVGLISEVFRRRADVLRSVNPLHPVLAQGPLAAWLVADHDKTPYSCGQGSPFERFLRLDGKFLFFDAPYSSLTFVHYVEHRFREQLPVELYDEKPAILRVRDKAGSERTVRQFFFSESARARRNFTAIEHSLLESGLMQKARLGNTRLLCVSARSVVECAERLVEQVTGFYK